VIEILAENRLALEKELRERVHAFFKANNEAPGSVSIEMSFPKIPKGNKPSTIDILVKDSA